MDYNSGNGGGMGVIGWFFYVAIIAFAIVVQWKLFVKAGKPGWASLVPIYNILVLLEIVGKPWWYLLLLLIPVVDIVILIMVMIALAKVFGKDGGFAVGLIFLSIIFMAILAFGDAKYLGPQAAA
jgi:uncharacterized membrane protein YhaH (DUF805 family)